MRTPPTHPLIRALARDAEAGLMGRREFLTRATALGLAVPLASLPRPARAQQMIQRGGTLRMQMTVRGLTDPRLFDWTEYAWFTSGWLETLVTYDNAGHILPVLLAGWQVNEDASEYILDVRRGVVWSDGTPFTARDVARNIEGWCDTTLPGNSMAARMTALIDPETGQLREGAVTLQGDRRLRLRLAQPDITLLAGMADYPAQITPEGFDPETMLENPVGTGPYRPESHAVGEAAVLVRAEPQSWWGYAGGTGAYLDRIEFRDYGTDPLAWLDAAQAGEVDMLYETVGDFVEPMDALGWERSEVESGATITIRPNQNAVIDGRTPFADRRVRQGLAMAVSNPICLELGYADHGLAARNFHVGPMHPEFADLDGLPYDPAAGFARLRAAGFAETEFTLTSIDDGWRRATTDAVAAQLRDAGFKVAREVLPRHLFAPRWKEFPFSSTDWNHRPLGVQTLALAYRSGAAWNETGFASPEFDALLARANALPDAEARRGVMAKLQGMLRDEAVVIQPYWRKLYRHARPGLIGWDMHVGYLPQLARIGFTV